MTPLNRFVAPAVAVAIIATTALPSFSQSLVIAEFMASNQSSIRDEDGDYEDWIELLNQSTVAVNLEGWFLTDNATNLNKWAFPDLTLNPNERLLVFASAKDRQDPDSTLHTNFKLASEGEYLAIVRPDGLTVEQHFSPSFPLQSEGDFR